MTKRSFFYYFMVFMLISGLLSLTSCKRAKVADPGVTGPAGFRIILSGTANPSTLYVPRTDPAVFSNLRVTALNNDGTPAANKEVIFQDGGYGYFEGYEISVVRRTDAAGVVNMTYFIPPGASIKAELLSNISITLVDNGRLDSAHGLIHDTIPIRIVPYMTEGVVLHGHVLTPAGNGVGGVTVELQGADDNPSGVTVTRPSGSYELYVSGGWYGSIVPSHESYAFSPADYTFTATSPVYTDIDGLDFVGIFAGGNTLLTDVEEWYVGSGGGTTLVNVINSTGDSSIGYVLVPNSDWLTVSPSSGSTPGSFTIDADPNTTGLDRDGWITISATDTVSAALTVSVHQSSSDVSIDSTLAIDPTNMDVPCEGKYGASQLDYASVNIYNSGSIEAINFVYNTSADWIVLPTGLSANTTTTLTFSIEPNPGPQRTGYIQFTPTTTGVSNPNGVRLTITQDEGPSLAVDVASKDVDAGGETFNVWFTNPNNDSIPLTYSLSNSDSWLKASPENGSIPAQITVEISPNATGVGRTAVLTCTATWTTWNWGNVTLETYVTINQGE